MDMFTYILLNSTLFCFLQDTYWEDMRNYALDRWPRCEESGFLFSMSPSSHKGKLLVLHTKVARIDKGKMLGSIRDQGYHWLCYM